MRRARSNVLLEVVAIGCLCLPFTYPIANAEAVASSTPSNDQTKTDGTVGTDSGSLLELGKTYERLEESEKAESAYAEAARSQNPKARAEALSNLERVHSESRAGHKFAEDFHELFYAGLMAVAGLIYLICLWCGIRLVGVLVRFIIGSERKNPRMEVAPFTFGTGESNLLFDAFVSVIGEMERQAELASEIERKTSLRPVMRADAIGGVFGAALEANEKTKPLVAFIRDAWDPLPSLRIDGSALVVGHRCHIVTILWDGKRQLGRWSRSIFASAILSELKDIAYAAVLTVSSRS
jgi:hypothetical protein